MRTLSYTNVTPVVGITHQQSNLMAMLREAHFCERALIPPIFTLSGEHNYGRQLKTRLTEYFDLEAVKVRGQPVPVINEGPEGKTISAEAELTERMEQSLTKDVQGIALLGRVFEKIYHGFEVPVQLQVHPKLAAVAESLKNQIPQDAAWLHLRRGDLLHKTAQGTSPENIRRVLEQVSPKTNSIYIATNETDLSYLYPLTERYDVRCLQDFPEFLALAEEDNYKLFLVEKLWGEMFPIRISTFRTGGRKFQGYLCDKAGWQ